MQTMRESASVFVRRRARAGISRAGGAPYFARLGWAKICNEIRSLGAPSSALSELFLDVSAFPIQTCRAAPFRQRSGAAGLWVRCLLGAKKKRRNNFEFFCL